MRRSIPLAIESHGPDHPAVRAWHQLGGEAPASVELWRRPSKSKPSVYRLIFEDHGRPALFAKRSPDSDLAVERLVYQEILPQLPVAAPRCHGWCRDRDGAAWLFIEDVGNCEPSRDSADHHVLAARWLGRLHASGAAAPGAVKLPDAGAGRYLAHLRSGSATVERNLENPWLAPEDRPVLTGLLAELEALEERWPRIARAAQALPVTIVHGDFRRKNARIAAEGVGPDFLAIDWEMAGWGNPAADLAGAFSPGAIVRIDPPTYQATARDLWRDADADVIRRAAFLGRVFQALASVDWACADLVAVSERHLIRPLASLRVYRRELSEAIAAGEEWLAWS